MNTNTIPMVRCDNCGYEGTGFVLLDFFKGGDTPGCPECREPL